MVSKDVFFWERGQVLLKLLTTASAEAARRYAFPSMQLPDNLLPHIRMIFQPCVYFLGVVDLKWPFKSYIEFCVLCVGGGWSRKHGRLFPYQWHPRSLCANNTHWTLIQPGHLQWVSHNLESFKSLGGYIYPLRRRTSWDCACRWPIN